LITFASHAGRALYSLYGLTEMMLKAIPKNKHSIVKKSMKTLRSYIQVIIIVVITENGSYNRMKKKSLKRSAATRNE